MIVSAPQIIRIISPFVLPAIMISVGISVGAVCLVYGVRLVKRQLKLYNSITLVQLKSFKIHYWAFFMLTAFFAVYTVFQMIDPSSPEVVLLGEIFLMHRWQSNLMMAFLLLMLLCVEFLFFVLARSRSAVVDRGVYTNWQFLDWYHVHGYYIDEEKCVVILSSDRATFSTLYGTTPPLRVAKNDIAKLKFILNKNKNRFSEFER